MKILLVDDEPLLLGILTEFLEESGHEVQSAESAELGLKLFLEDAESFHVILSDIKMQGMNGLDLLRAVKAQKFKIPVIMMSGHVEAEMHEETQKMGAFACLLKPFKFPELFELLEQCEAKT